MGTFYAMCTLYSVYPTLSIIGGNCHVHYEYIYTLSSRALVHFGWRRSRIPLVLLAVGLCTVLAIRGHFIV